jgi:hypothetical protein
MSITYNIEDPNYYKTINKFTNTIIKEEKKYLTYINNYTKHAKNKTKKEAILESLIIGTYWNNYIQNAINLNQKDYIKLTNLLKQREEKKELKNEIDQIRGQLNTKIIKNNKTQKSRIKLNLHNLKKLIKFLEATGEFKYEIKHLNTFLDYLETLNINKIEKILREIQKFTKNFQDKAEKTLGKYTINIKEYLKTSQIKHKNKEDIILCSRNINEYYLEMFGAEIMNQINHQEFQKRPRKALILPGCMRLPKNICKGEKTHLGDVCKKCNAQCPTYKLKKQGEKEKFEVYTITHESDAFKNASQEDKKELGIIGVACTLNLINGGWKAGSLGIPAQCVILDQVGCTNHWSEKPKTIKFNIKQLNTILI